MTREEAIKFAEYAQIMADGKPDVQEFYKLAESALRQQEHFREVTKKVEPLTLDEMRKMEGEPAYIVCGKWKDWRIPDFIDIGAYKGFIRFTDKSAEPIDEYGKTWLAYRSKPEEDAHE